MNEHFNNWHIIFNRYLYSFQCIWLFGLRYNQLEKRHSFLLNSIKQNEILTLWNRRDSKTFSQPYMDPYGSVSFLAMVFQFRVECLSSFNLTPTINLKWVLYCICVFDKRQHPKPKKLLYSCIRTKFKSVLKRTFWNWRTTRYISIMFENHEIKLAIILSFFNSVVCELLGL